MTSRYGGITGSKNISEDFQNINTAFENVESDMDANKEVIDNHISSTKAHTAEHITYTGEAPGNNVKEAIDNTHSRISDIVAQAGDDNTEIVDARGEYPVLSARLDASDAKKANRSEVVFKGDLVYSIKDFGAKGDGINDDTKAIQSAIDVANQAGGGVVLIPAGTWNVSGLIIKDFVTLQGVGKQTSVIKLISGADNHVIATPNFDTLIETNPGIGGLVKTAGLKMLCLDGNKANQAEKKHGLAYLGIDLQLEEVEIKNCKGLGTWIESSSGIWSITVGQNLQTSIRHIEVHDNDLGNLYYNGQSDSTMIDILCFETGIGLGQFNFKFGPKSSGCRVIGLHCWGASDYGVINEAGTAGFTHAHVESAAVAKVWMKAATYFDVVYMRSVLIMQHLHF